MKKQNKIKDIPYFNDHERFFSKIKVNIITNCWEWTASINKSGYGKFHIINSDYFAHRVSYSLFKNDLTTDLVIDHICRNRKCVNPDHLRVVDVYINITENSLSGAAKNKIKTHCLRGHEFTPENTIRYKKLGRNCRSCRTCFYTKRRIRRANGSRN